jgi:hypothetical protein
VVVPVPVPDFVLSTVFGVSPALGISIGDPGVPPTITPVQPVLPTTAPEPQHPAPIPNPEP